MQKKLLLFCVIMNCTIQANETETINQKDYTEYTKQQEKLYHAALVKALSNQKEAIEDEDRENKHVSENEAKKSEQENKDEEESKRKKYYDGVTGYWGSQPTSQSKTGLKFEKYAQQAITKNQLNNEDRKCKDVIWQQYSKDAKEKKDIFNKEVLVPLGRKLESKRYLIYEDKLPALMDCREKLACYDEHALSATIFTNSDFGKQYEMKLYKSVAELSAQKGIPVTIEELRTIAENNPVTKEFFKGFQAGIKELCLKRDEIINPKKQDGNVPV